MEEVGGTVMVPFALHTHWERSLEKGAELDEQGKTGSVEME